MQPLVNDIRFASTYDLLVHARTEGAKLGFNLFMATGYPSNMLVIGDYSQKRWRDSLKDLDDADVMVRVLNHESLHYVLNRLVNNIEEADRLGTGLDAVIDHNLTKGFDEAMKQYGRQGLFQYIQYSVSKNLYDDFLSI